MQQDINIDIHYYIQYRMIMIGVVIIILSFYDV